MKKNSIKRSQQIAKVAKLLRTFHSLAGGRASEENRYFLTRSNGQFIKVSSFKQRNALSSRLQSANRDLSLHPPDMKEHLRWRKRCLFDTVIFPSAADIILLRANISLFYLVDGIRIKIDTGNPVRSADALKVEYSLRKQVERLNILKVPRLLEGRFDQNPPFFIDEVISGRLLTWKDRDAESVFRRVIPDMWKYYQAMGIRWMTPGECGDDLARVIREYTQSLARDPEIHFPFDVKKIEAFGGRKLPCTQIHGDLAIHNILVSSKGDYLLDWESSTFDYMMRDFYKLLIIEGWSLDRQIRPLMEKEMARQPRSAREHLLALNDQLYWILFLETHHMLTTPSYPRRLLKRAQDKMAAFLSSRHSCCG